jgi:hypothetical protein
MRAGRAVQEHGLRAGHWHVEGSDVGLPILKGDVATVNATVHGRACSVRRRLRDGVVAIGELELHNVTNGGDDGVGDKGVLRAADDDGDDLILALEGTRWNWHVSKQRCDLANMGGYLQCTAGVLANFVEGCGSATTTLVRRRALAMKDFMLYSDIGGMVINDFEMGKSAQRYV